ncbi:MAG: hypothetical protein ORN98_09165 [Alphaproteobacteria bacterium]|nr:hypothetical protein [Alphaproteobacteria bacterium]
MINVSLDLNPEIETHLTEFAASTGTDHATAIGRLLELVILSAKLNSNFNDSESLLPKAQTLKEIALKGDSKNFDAIVSWADRIERIVMEQAKAREFRPNADTLAAIAELESGGGKSFNTIEELMADLDADSWTPA